MKDNIFELKNISYGYIDGGKKRKFLNDLSYAFERGKFYTILGPSGSGKTSLLALASDLDTPEKEQVFFEGKDIKKMNTQDLEETIWPLYFRNTT